MLIAVLSLATVVAGCSCEEAVTVPNLVGLEEIEARDALSDAGLELGDVERLTVEADAPEVGTVLSQVPTAGSEVDSGSEVALVVAEGPQEEASEEEGAEEAPSGSESGSGGEEGSGTGSSSDSGTDAGTRAKEAWHTVAKSSGTGDHIGPDISLTKETPLELTVAASSSPPGAEFRFYLLDTKMGSHEIHATVSGTATTETHAFEPVTVPAGEYGMRVDIPALKTPPAPNVSWSYTLREWR